MSQSASEPASSDHEDSEKPVYAYEQVYHDSADKAYIQSLPAVERETIIARRIDENTKVEQNAMLRRLVLQREKDAKKLEQKAKRTADEAGLDESQRKSSRQRTKVGGESRGAIDRYKQQRAEKTLRDENRRHNRSARRSVSPVDDYSEDDAQGESDYDDRRPIKRRSPSPVRDDPPADLADINRVRIGRENFAEVFQTPGFDQAVVGCYARVNLGPGKTPGVNEYRLCLIKGVRKGRTYAMTALNRQQVLTDKYITVAYGKAERDWSFLETSMQKFTEAEWTRYRATMANDEKIMPTKGVVDRKLPELNKLITHKWTDPEITAKVQAQETLMRAVTKADEREKIEGDMDKARVKKDWDEVERLQESLQNIVHTKLAMGTTLVKKHDAKNTEQDRLAALNRKNNHLNTENIRKAQLAEMHARRIRQQQKRAESPAIKDDLFGDGSDISRAGTPGLPSRSGTPKPNGTPLGTPRSGTPIPLKPVKKKGGLPVIRRAALDDEIIGAMDLGIEL